MSTFFIIIICISGLLLLLGPIILIGTSKKFSKLASEYSKNSLDSKILGAEFVDTFLQDAGITNVNVVAVPSELDNSYSPKTETIYLSIFALSNSSVYSAAVCSHEVGHAKMHQKGDRIVGFWYTLAKLDNILCRIVLPFFLIGFICSFVNSWIGNLGEILLKLSTICTFLALFYRIISIKNEDAASTIAIQDLEKSQALNKHELKQTQNLLNCALSTYFVEFYERIFYNLITVKKITEKIIKRKQKNKK